MIDPDDAPCVSDFVNTNSSQQHAAVDRYFVKRNLFRLRNHLNTKQKGVLLRKKVDAFDIGYWGKVQHISNQRNDKRNKGIKHGRLGVS